MSNQASREPSQRQLKVGEELRHALSQAFMRGDFYDPESKKALQVTISEVRISPDLKNATIYAIPMSGQDVECTMEMLGNLIPQLRHVIAKKVRLKFVPQIHFKLDDTFDNAFSLETILNRPDVRKDLESE